MGKTSSGSVWIKELGMFGGFQDDGSFHCPNGFAPDFDPFAVTYVADRTVRRVANRDAHLRRVGFTVSPTALNAALTKYAKGKLERAMTLQELKDHKVFGATMPSLDVIRAAYEEEEEVAVA